MDALDRINMERKKRRNKELYTYYGYAIIAKSGDNRKAIYVSKIPYKLDKDSKKTVKNVKVFGINFE